MPPTSPRTWAGPSTSTSPRRCGVSTPPAAPRRRWPTSTSRRSLTEFEGGLYFQANDPTFGTELWRSDGTDAGTERLTDINPGPGNSLINALVVAGDNLFFRGDDGGPTGVELWEAHGGVTPPDPPVQPPPTGGGGAATDTSPPRLQLSGASKQKSKSKVLVTASCDEACDLRATGKIKVKVLKGKKVKKTTTLKLKSAQGSGGPGQPVRLKLKIDGKAKKLVKKVLRKKPSRATVEVEATDVAGNGSSAKQTIKVVKKKRT